MRTYHDWEQESPHKAELLAACAACIRKIAPEAEVILYGSVARGEETPDSDVDLLVLVPQEVTYKLEREISDRIYEIELEREEVISLIVRQRSQWNASPLRFTPLYRSIANEGVSI
jgi:predicted nucleotidyltransferase